MKRFLVMLLVLVPLVCARADEGDDGEFESRPAPRTPAAKGLSAGPGGVFFQKLGLLDGDAKTLQPHKGEVAPEELGVKWVRLEVDCQGAAQANMDDYVRYTEQLLGKGIHVMLAITYQTIRRTDDKEQDRYEPGQNSYVDRLADYAGAMAVRLKDHAGSVAFEIWNEGDDTYPISPESMAALLLRSYAKIKDASPNFTVIFGGVCNPNKPHVSLVLKLMKGSIQKVPFDAVGVHFYPWTTFSDAEYDARNIAWRKELADIPEAKDIPFWCTEWGWNATVGAPPTCDTCLTPTDPGVQPLEPGENEDPDPEKESKNVNFRKLKRLKADSALYITGALAWFAKHGEMGPNFYFKDTDFELGDKPADDPNRPQNFGLWFSSGEPSAYYKAFLGR